MPSDFLGLIFDIFDVINNFFHIDFKTATSPSLPSKSFNLSVNLSTTRLFLPNLF